MEYLCGKRSATLERADFVEVLNNYREVLVDLGTGDGRYVRSTAQAHPEKFVIGLDACRENLVKTSSNPQSNTLYLIANAAKLPEELRGLATGVSINFPWGSLLSGLLDRQSGLIAGLQSLVQPGATLEVRLNESALLKAGRPLDQAAAIVERNLQEHNFELASIQKLDRVALRTCPTTWAKRLAFGRDTQAFYLKTVYSGPGLPVPACSNLACLTY